MKKGSTIYAIVAVAMFFISSVCNAQSAQNASVIYLQADDITVEKYQALQNALKSHSEFTVKEVCIPAHVIAINQLTGNPDEQAFAQFKSIAATVNILNISLRTDYNDEKFLQKCKSARSVN